MKSKHLLVISDTKGQFRDGSWYIFNAVANELYFINDVFESITIILSDYSTEDIDVSLNLLKGNIKVVALPKIGGKTILSKLKTAFILPIYLFQIIRNLLKSDMVHLRGPNTVTLVSILILPIFQFKNVWFKYATNWNNVNSSLNYKFQKWFLTKVLIKTKVTINGFWQNLPTHILPFENPCLTELQVIEGKEVINSKKFDTPYNLIFVGRIDAAKGVDILLDFIRVVNKKDIGFFHVVGEGELRGKFENVLNKVSIPNKFYGNLTQAELFELLKISDCILLPSKSEGFPKVLAEAMNFGCIPIASNVGSIAHYIRDGDSGIILNHISLDGLNEAWNNFLNIQRKEKQTIALNGFEVSRKFTFEKYLDKVKMKVFNVF